MEQVPSLSASPPFCPSGQGGIFVLELIHSSSSLNNLSFPHETFLIILHFRIPLADWLTCKPKTARTYVSLPTADQHELWPVPALVLLARLNSGKGIYYFPWLMVVPYLIRLHPRNFPAWGSHSLVDGNLSLPPPHSFIHSFFFLYLFLLLLSNFSLLSFPFAFPFLARFVASLLFVLVVLSASLFPPGSAIELILPLPL